MSHPTADRTANLKQAARLDQKLARETAFVLADDDTTALRDSAAEVILDTTALTGDANKLERLIDTETVASIQSTLERALRAIEAGTVGDALHSLLVFLGLTDGQLTATPKTLLPNESWHKGFISDVNGLLEGARTPDSPKSFLISACNLGDTLAEQALIARYAAKPDDTSLKPDQERKIRENLPRKPDVGALLKQQHHQSKFRWFNNLLSLREYRPAHTAPVGNTEPLKLGLREFNRAKGYLEDVVDGWIGSMYETDGMP